MRGRKRPADERARAVGIAVITGASEAARQTGIPERTIAEWIGSDEFANLRERKKDEVAAEWWGFVQQAFRRTSELLDKTDDPVKAATAGAIVFDKMAMSRGEATARSEVTHLRDYDDHERRELRDFIDRLAGDSGGPRDQEADSGDAGSEVREPAATPLL